MRRLLLYLTLGVPAFTQVVFNNTNTMVHVSGNSLSSPFSVTAGANVVAFACAVYDQTAGESITSITYGGQTMTSAGPAAHGGSGGNSLNTAVFYLINPPTGSNTLAIATTAGTNNLYGNIISFKGVNQTTPVRSGTYQATSGLTAQNPSMTIPSNAGSPSNPADLTMTCFEPGMSGAGVTNQTIDGWNGSGYYAAGHDHATTAGATVTHTWTSSNSGSYALVGFSIMSQPPAPALSLSGCPASGNYGTASATCTITATYPFDGVGTVTFTDSNQTSPGTFTIGGVSHAGSITTTPVNGSTSFTLTYTSSTVGARALTTTNTLMSGASNWTNATWAYTGTSAQPCNFTMTGSGTQSIAATSGWTSTGSCGHSAPTTGDSLVVTASGGTMIITVPNDGATHMLGACPAANTTYDLQLTAVSAGSAVFDVQPGAKFYFCGNKKLTSVVTTAGSTPTVWADLKYETGATVYEDEAQASYAHRTVTGASGEWARLLWGSSSDSCTFGPGTAYTCPTNIQSINAASVYPTMYDPNATTDSHLFKVYGTSIKYCGSATIPCFNYATGESLSWESYSDAGAIYFGGDALDTTGTVQSTVNGFVGVAQVNVANTHFINDLAGFASRNAADGTTLQSCTIQNNYFSGVFGNGSTTFPCTFTGNVFPVGLSFTYNPYSPLKVFAWNVMAFVSGVNEDFEFTVPLQHNYLVWPFSVSSNHGFQSPSSSNDVYRGNLFEALESSGEGHCTAQGAASTNTVVMLDNLSLPSANGVNSCQAYGWAAGSGNPTMTVGWFDHNGAYGTGDFSWFIFTTHPTAKWPGNQTLRSLRANVGWSPSVVASNLAVSTQGDTGASGAPNGTVYVPGEGWNSWYNPATSTTYGAGYNTNCNPSTSQGTPYDQCTASGTPGTHDVTGNPKLIDPTRGLFKWASVKHGQAASLAGAEAAFQGCQNLQACIMELEAWVRQGYQPTNLALKGAAHDGGVVGVSGTPGSGYSGACSASVTVQDADDLGTGAALSCSFVGGVPVVTVANPGMHYRVATPATVTITGTGGSGTALNVLVSPSDIGPVPITLFAGVAP